MVNSLSLSLSVCSPLKVEFFVYNIFIPRLFNPVVAYRRQFCYISIRRLVDDLSAGGRVTIHGKSKCQACKSGQTRVQIDFAFRVYASRASDQ